MFANVDKLTCSRFYRGPREQTSILRRLLTIRMSARTTPSPIGAQFLYISVITHLTSIQVEFFRSECQQHLPASLKGYLSNLILRKLLHCDGQISLIFNLHCMQRRLIDAYQFSSSSVRIYTTVVFANSFKQHQPAAQHNFERIFKCHS